MTGRYSILTPEELAPYMRPRSIRDVKGPFIFGAEQGESPLDYANRLIRTQDVGLIANYGRSILWHVTPEGRHYVMTGVVLA